MPPTMRRARETWFAYVQLLRLPNLFTAVADPLAGWLAVGGGGPPAQLFLLAGVSAGLYTAGIVLNDCFDYALDCRERPERPLPRGAIPRAHAWALAALLMGAALVAAALAGPPTLGVALSLAVLILFYNSWAKRFFFLGPLVLGVCRFANFLLGMRSAPLRLWWIPGLLGVYVAVLTLLSRQEAGNPARQRTIKRLILGIIVVDAALVTVRGDPVGALLVLSLLVPAIALGKLLPMT